MTTSRLPKLALVLMVLDELKSWGWGFFAAVVGLINGGGWVVVALGAGLVVLCLLSAGVRYWRFSYLLDTDNVTINSGLLVRKVRHIPYTKIQTVRRQQWFFLRPFHLESVTLETSGQEGKGGEAGLYAVPQSVAQAIEAHRHHVSTEVASTPTVDPAPAVDASYRIDAHDLNLYAVTSLGFLPIIAALFWLADKLQDVVPKSWQTRADDALAHAAIILIVALVLVVLIIGLAVSYLNLIQRYYHFTLTRNGDTLAAERGLFKTISVSVRLRRIQALRFKQSLLRHAFHLTTVQALTASNAADDEKENDLVILPVVQADRALSTAREFVGWLPTHAPALTYVAPAQRWYYLRNALLFHLVWLLPVLLAVWRWLPRWLPAAGILALLWLAWALGAAAYGAKRSGVAVQADQLCIQTSSAFAHERFYVRHANIQSMRVRNSIWLRQKHLAHLEINVRSGDGNEAISVRYLPQATVAAILTWYQPEAPFLLA